MISCHDEVVAGAKARAQLRGGGAKGRVVLVSSPTLNFPTIEQVSKQEPYERNGLLVFFFSSQLREGSRDEGKHENWAVDKIVATVLLGPPRVLQLGIKTASTRDSYRSSRGPFQFRSPHQGTLLLAGSWVLGMAGIHFDLSKTVKSRHGS